MMSSYGLAELPGKSAEQRALAEIAAQLRDVVPDGARELLNKSENERSGVLSTAMSFLGLYRDPVVAKVTHHCDWRIRDLVEGDRPALPRLSLAV